MYVWYIQTFYCNLRLHVSQLINCALNTHAKAHAKSSDMQVRPRLIVQTASYSPVRCKQAWLNLSDEQGRILQRK